MSRAAPGGPKRVAFCGKNKRNGGHITISTTSVLVCLARDYRLFPCRSPEDCLSFPRHIHSRSLSVLYSKHKLHIHYLRLVVIV